MNRKQTQAKQAKINTPEIVPIKNQYMLLSCLFFSVASGIKLVDVALLKKSGKTFQCSNFNTEGGSVYTNR